MKFTGPWKGFCRVSYKNNHDKWSKYISLGSIHYNSFWVQPAESY